LYPGGRTIQFRAGRYAVSDQAKAFYLALGLSEPPLEPMTPMVTLADLGATL
jgi:hypothetical protein